ncbi:CDP-glycerol glycerophosphotransferase family protein [Stenoxybacter acetivorans]|uniref:CDP-glycerol glycerophosphotransferase family protein n=1 Tax=Stenoxybacter acetivorans TaxID=422441 RepID=UPI00068C5EA7|nr:CDP-glycerol glycerophosphotransferase family protein [Stenoxybacter acetivorans]
MNSIKKAQAYVNYYRGVLHYQKDEWDKAKLFFEKSIQQFPLLAEANFKYGVLLLKTGEAVKAEEFISKAIEINPARTSWNKQLQQAIKKKGKQSVGIHKSAPRRTSIKKNIDIYLKKKLLLVPSAYNERVLVDILPFIDTYYQQFDIYIILKEQPSPIIDYGRYTVVNNGTSYADYLKFTAEYVIDAGSLDFFYKISDKNYWASVWHGIPYKKMFVDFDVTNMNTAVRYARAYQSMVSMSDYYTQWIKKSLLFHGDIAQLGSAKIDLLLNPPKVFCNEGQNKLLYLNFDIQNFNNTEAAVGHIRTVLTDFNEAEIAIDVSHAKSDKLSDFIRTLLEESKNIQLITDDSLLWNYIAAADYVFNANIELIEKFNATSTPIFLSYFYKANQIENKAVYRKLICDENGISSVNEVDIGDILTQKPNKRTKPVTDYFKMYYGIPTEKKVILYAPTYRETGDAKLPFDAQRLLNSLNNEYVLLVKLHYLNQLDEADKINGVYDFSNNSNLYGLMNCSDILLSDYSSLIFDYALLNKPIILFQYDFFDYLNNRGVYFDFKEYLPAEQIIYNENKLYEVFTKPLQSDNQQLKQTFYPLEQGNSTQKVIDYFCFDATPRKIKDIIFLVNDLNQIGGIHTFMTNMAKYYKEQYNARVHVIAIKEFSHTNQNFYKLDNKFFDVMISAEFLVGACQNILQNTDGIVISLQFSAHLHFQKFLQDAKVVLMFHGDTKDIVSRNLYGPHLNWLNSGELFNYDKFILLTKKNADLISKHVNEEIQEKITFIPNSITEAYHALPRTNNYHVAYIGRLDEDKNIFGLIELANVVSEKYPEIVVHVYGDGPKYPELLKLVEKHKLQNHIIFHGYEADKSKIFSQVSGLILLSQSEGFSLVVLESYAHNRPVVVFNSYTAASEVVAHQQSGYLVEFGDYETFAQNILKLNQLSENDIRAKYQEFSNERVFAKWNSLFTEL